MTTLEALRLVRNMAYEFTDRGYALHDLPGQIEGEVALDMQTEALDRVDILIYRVAHQDAELLR